MHFLAYAPPVLSSPRNFVYNVLMYILRLEITNHLPFGKMVGNRRFFLFYWMIVV
jgi:hypothetical protein